MLKTVSEVERLLISLRHNLQLDTDKTSKLRFISKTVKPYTCSNCRGTTCKGDVALTGQFMTEHKEVYALCQNCIMSFLNQQGVETKVILTSNVLDNTLERTKAKINTQRKRVGALVDEFTTDKDERKKLKKKYKNKLDIIHNNLTYVLITLKDNKCFICKCSIPKGDTAFSKKVFVIGSRRQYAKKLCLDCANISILDALNDNEKVINSVRDLLT